jgi:hypothetical protein
VLVRRRQRGADESVSAFTAAESVGGDAAAGAAAAALSPAARVVVSAFRLARRGVAAGLSAVVSATGTATAAESVERPASPFTHAVTAAAVLPMRSAAVRAAPAGWRDPYHHTT